MEHLRDPARFGAWLCSIAINLAQTRRSPAYPGSLSWEALSEAEWFDARQPLPEVEVIKHDLVKRVQAAISDLPPAEREAVMLVYLNELSHQEAATQLGSSLSAIKVRVHRGRRRLREALQYDFDDIIIQQKLLEGEMIKVHIHDVISSIKPEAIPAGDEEVNWLAIFGVYRVILLKEEGGNRALPIWIGPYEGDAILFQLRQAEPKRPMTYELIKTLLDLGNVVVERMVVSRLNEETFYGSLIVKTDVTESEVDCRPSDGINLALRFGVPIFVDTNLIAQAGITPDPDGIYSWAQSREKQIQRAANETKREELAKIEWIWLPMLGLDYELLAQGHIKIGERTLRLDAAAKELAAKTAKTFK